MRGADSLRSRVDDLEEGHEDHEKKLTDAHEKIEEILNKLKDYSPSDKAPI